MRTSRLIRRALPLIAVGIAGAVVAQRRSAKPLRQLLPPREPERARPPMPGTQPATAGGPTAAAASPSLEVVTPPRAPASAEPLEVPFGAAAPPPEPVAEPAPQPESVEPDPEPKPVDEPAPPHEPEPPVAPEPPPLTEPPRDVPPPPLPQSDFLAGRMPEPEPESVPPQSDQRPEPFAPADEESDTGELPEISPNQLDFSAAHEDAPPPGRSFDISEIVDDLLPHEVRGNEEDEDRS